MPDEERYLLYSEPSFRLASISNAVERGLFWDILAERAVALPADAAFLRTAIMGQGRILRVVRTANAVPVSFHFLVLEQPSAGGLVIIRLQPLMAWRDRFGGQPGTDPMLAADARVPLLSLREELAQIGEMAAANIGQ